MSVPSRKELEDRVYDHANADGFPWVLENLIQMLPNRVLEKLVTRLDDPYKDEREEEWVPING